MNRFIGVDIAKDSFEACFAQPGARPQVLGFANTAAGFTALLERLLPQDTVVMEASGPYHLQLALFLYQHQVQLSVVNPLIIKRYAQMRMSRTKTDRKDAMLIAAYAREQRPKLWLPEKPFILQIKQKMTLLEQLEKQSTSLLNQLHSLSLSPDADQDSLALLGQLIGQLKEAIHKLEMQLEALIQEHSPEPYARLLSVPGIGKKTAVLLLALTGGFSRFAHSKQLMSYVGLCPRVYESGTSVRGKARICKMGMGRIRKLLYMCTWSAKRYNRYCKELYERLKAKGKPERVIKIALANKLLRQAFAVVKNDTLFNKNLALTIVS